MRAACLLVLLSACSFTTATGFTECVQDLQCGSNHSCARGYCVAMAEGCSRFEGPFESPGVIRLAALLPLRRGSDGKGDPLEQNLLYGMGLAINEVNQQKLASFALYACDTQSNDSLAIKQIEWAVGQMQLPALLTSGNAVSFLAAQNTLRKEAGTLVMSPNASGLGFIDLFQADHATFRVAPPDSAQASVMAQLLTENEQYITQTKVAVVYQDDDDRDRFAHELSGRVADAGRTTREFVYPVQVNATDLVNRMKTDLGPTASVLIGSAAQIQVVMSVAAISNGLERSTGHRWLLSSSAKTPALFSTPIVARELDGMLGVAPTQGTDAMFPGRLGALYGVETSVAPSGYDAAFMVMLASVWDSQDAGALTGPRMAKGMLSMTSDGGSPLTLGGLGAWREAVTLLKAKAPISVKGVTGQLNFDVNVGAPNLPFDVWRVSDGGFAFVRLATP